LLLRILLRVSVLGWRLRRRRWRRLLPLAIVLPVLLRLLLRLRLPLSRLLAHGSDHLEPLRPCCPVGLLLLWLLWLLRCLWRGLPKRRCCWWWWCSHVRRCYWGRRGYIRCRWPRCTAVVCKRFGVGWSRVGWSSRHDRRRRTMLLSLVLSLVLALLPLLALLTLLLLCLFLLLTLPLLPLSLLSVLVLAARWGRVLWLRRVAALLLARR
jgi:hypothetical protein